VSETFHGDERDKIALGQLMKEIDSKYPSGWYVAVDDVQVIAASADFDELLGELRAQSRNPRDTMVIEAGAKRPEYVTIFM
jgi:hypothetical protein